VNLTMGIVVMEMRYWLFLKISAVYMPLPMVFAIPIGINFNAGLFLVLFLVVHRSISLSSAACSMLLLTPMVLVTAQLLVVCVLQKWCRS